MTIYSPAEGISSPYHNLLRVSKLTRTNVDVSSLGMEHLLGLRKGRKTWDPRRGRALAARSADFWERWEALSTRQVVPCQVSPRGSEAAVERNGLGDHSLKSILNIDHPTIETPNFEPHVKSSGNMYQSPNS